MLDRILKPTAKHDSSGDRALRLAVDLYVLERAFASTHPASEKLFQTILDSYAEEVTARSSGKNRGKGGRLGRWEETRRKLEEGKLLRLPESRDRFEVSSGAD